MNDTTPEMEARYHQMLMALSPDPSELRRRLLLRFYGNDLPESTIRRFLTASGERGC